MKILITGGLGYIGSVLSCELKEKNTKLIGIDPFWFSKSAVTNYLEDYDELHQCPISDLSDQKLANILKTIDCVVSLAAVSNDPMGNEFESITHDVNFEQNVRLYQLSKQAY